MMGNGGAVENGERELNGVESKPASRNGHAAPLPKSDRSQFPHQAVERHRMAAITTLSAGVAHQINNPLTYLLVNLEHVTRKLRTASASYDPMTELAGAQAGLPALPQTLQHAIEGANRT